MCKALSQAPCWWGDCIRTTTVNWASQHSIKQCTKEMAGWLWERCIADAQEGHEDGGHEHGLSKQRG